MQCQSMEERGRVRWYRIKTEKMLPYSVFTKSLVKAFARAAERMTKPEDWQKRKIQTVTVARKKKKQLYKMFWLE